MKECLVRLTQAMRESMCMSRGKFIVYLVLRIIVIVCAAGTLVLGNYEASLLCLLVLVLLFVPSFLEAEFRINIPDVLEVIIALFIFAAEILGEIFRFYTIIPFWDTLLHTFNGFLAAAVGLALVSILNGSNRVTFLLSPFFCVVMAFCFSMTVGVVWEFFEFGMDQAFGFDMQKDTVISHIDSILLDETGTQTPVHIDGIESVSVNGEDLAVSGMLDVGLYDTMEDLMVNFIGALLFSVIGYEYLKSKGQNPLVKNLVPTVVLDDNELLQQNA